jgi:hypothetical protein
MPIDATPLEHVVLPVATKLTGEDNVNPFPGAVRFTVAKAEAANSVNRKIE